MSKIFIDSPVQQKDFLENPVILSISDTEEDISKDLKLVECIWLQQV